MKKKIYIFGKGGNSKIIYEISKQKYNVAGFIFIINLFDLPGEKLLKKKNYFTESLIEFPGH